MMPSRRWFTLDVAITGVRVDEVNHRLAITDRARRHTLVDLATLKLLRVTNFSKPAQLPFDYYQRSMCLLGLDRLFFWPRDSKYGYLVEIDKVVSFVFRFTHHHGAVTKVALSHSEYKLISGDEKGRSYVINLFNGAIEHRLPALPDAISALCFSSDDVLVSVAGFHGGVLTHNLFLKEQISHIKLGSVVEAMAYLEKTIALVVLRDGRVLKIETEKGVILQETKLPIGVWPTTLFIAPNKKFCFIGTRQSNMVAFHVTSLEQMFVFDFGCGGVSVLAQSEAFFFVGFTSGELAVLNYREYEKEFSREVDLGNLDEANAFFNKNAFLMTHESTWKMYEQWLEAKKSITVLLSEGSLEKAQQEAKPFMFHPKCRLEMEVLEGQQGELAALLRCIKTRDFARAYDLCEKTPFLKQSEHYKKLEQMWRTLYSKAQRLLSRDPASNKSVVLEMLALFLKIPEKNHEVALMFKHLMAFQEAELRIREQDFKAYFKLVEQYPFLKETAVYEKVGWLQEELKQKLQRALAEQDFTQANKLAKALQEFTPSAPYAAQKIDHIKQVLSLDTLLGTGRMLEACAVVSRLGIWNEEYGQIQHYKKAKERFLVVLKKQIREGKMREVYTKITPFQSIEEGRQIHQEIMRFLYEHQITTHLGHQSRTKVDWEMSLRHFLQFFAINKALDDKLRLAHIAPPKPYQEDEPAEDMLYPLSIIHYQNV
ncbi:hypothetical protein JWV37_10620 [Sulfurospirillum sp. T05]|uniref:Vacuolar protein sorting-associated protein 16 homolog n=1 Tax=Sulfurospirillum tamanense TaxID=2813362 RepID=A0ABS2WUB0_9BACT|nr:hypothetical protein [Sulfurospirillum tamanensis]MBN2965236.1 hypothetical protein [Sulfurospirillum tamanensis]